MEVAVEKVDGMEGSVWAPVDLSARARHVAVQTDGGLACSGHDGDDDESSAITVRLRAILLEVMLTAMRGVNGDKRELHRRRWVQNLLKLSLDACSSLISQVPKPM